ncbi:uncharacterized protein TM35_000281880 [Trypanosoma theileri]|uniref:Transglutaminase n=1 Tax=Trypanosoma theileri TaxID=67003 RepID=A0A1X0NP34_9TRYP|nr:uncharacterized protein TM35_000281880 [Trypanosoma theileri]ORC86472.1 hypothetical protein TM35_000281880 [Trypanosoma theileri]
MTTMFIQLRRVVYLLVLLQCCACGVNAISAQEGRGGNDGVPEVNHTRDAEVGEGRLQELVNRAYKLYLQGRGCVEVLKKETATCDESKDIAKKAAEATKKAVDALKTELDEGKKKDKGRITEEKIKNLKLLVEDARGKIAESKKVVQKKNSLLRRTRVATTACWISYGDLNDEVTKLNETRDGLKSLLDDYRRTEREELIKNATQTGGDLFWLMQEVTLTLRRGRENKTAAEREVWEADQIFQKAKTTLKEITEVVNKEVPERAEGHKLTELQQLVNESEEELKNVSVISSSIAQPAPAILQGGDATRYKEAYEREKTQDPATHEKRVNEEREKEEAMEAVKMELKKAEDEAARLLAEKIIREKQAEEERIRLEKLAEERKRQEKLAEEERKRQEKLAEEERKRQDKLAEEKRKKQEKLAEEERKRQEKFAEEKLGKAKEETERAAKMAKKKDSSYSPALMHSPLLLLLVLTVLGCTLVC